MRAAYLNQTINLAVAVLLVPLLVRYLDASEYILWSIFTTFGGITLQLESAIQTVSVREIAREYHSGNAATLQAAIRKAKVAYTTLSGSVLVPLFALGLLYLHYVASKRLGSQGTKEWLLFTSAYALNYYMGVNNSILLVMDRVSEYNNTTALTRVFNFTCTYLLLRAGLSIMGICVSFALSVVIGCLIMLRTARERLASYGSSPEARARPNSRFEDFNQSNTAKYTLYMLSSFALYRGGLLIATSILPRSEVAAYGLTLQATTMVSALALVPLQVWLSKLVSAITSGSQREVLRELSITIVMANGVFVVGSILLLVFGNILLSIIHSKVMFGTNASVLLVCFAFLVELNILLLLNFLVTRRNYEFVRIYLITSLVGTACVIITAWAFNAGLLTMILIPLSLQALVCLPLIFRLACHDLAVKPLTLLSQFGTRAFVRS